MKGQEAKTAGEVAVVMVPLPAQGNLNLLLHLSRLIASHDVPVYYTGAATHIRQAQHRLQGWSPHSLSTLHFHPFPTPSFDSPDPDPTLRSPAHLLPSFRAALLLRGPLREFLTDLSRTARRVVVIYDFWMAWNVQDVPSVPNTESYAFRSTSALSTLSFNWDMMMMKHKLSPLPPEVSQVLIKDHPDLDAPSSSSTQELSELDKLQLEAPQFNSGTIFNTCEVLEGTFLDLLAANDRSMGPMQWAIGPFNPVISAGAAAAESSRHPCLSWLDQQEENSVIFVSFGSTITLPQEQINEIAVGLEKSGRKFIWAVREADKGDIFAGEEKRVALPDGYEEEIKGKGIAARDWVPQLEILAHPSTGGFLSHCGWNSCVEAISMGVPIAAWPVHSDQPRNAALITEVLKIGFEVDGCGGRGVVRSGRIREAVLRLMGGTEGDEMRRRAEELSRAVKLSVLDRGGASRKEMESILSHITRE
ncbi:unnamed protein product [Cuscuta campestris]|uniref:Glycosyltransferase n=1 Tax=Cuscuta campestris TaxID=132261 RepID=A0A484MQF1_9ASTE|nr:unnamed protein product [Cuscuta campestris]